MSTGLQRIMQANPPPTGRHESPPPSPGQSPAPGGTCGRKVMLGAPIESMHLQPIMPGSEPVYFQREQELFVSLRVSPPKEGILVLEDTPMQQKLVSVWLKQIGGYEPPKSFKGIDCQSQVAARVQNIVFINHGSSLPKVIEVCPKAFRAVVCDFSVLGDIDGPQAWEQVKKNYEGRQEEPPHCIGYSSEPEAEAKAVEVGMGAFSPKNPKQLAALVKAHLEELALPPEVAE